MKNADMPPVLDIRAFALSRGRIAGDTPLAAFERLAQESQGDCAQHRLVWAAQAELKDGASGALDPWLHLTVKTRMPMTCQRCLSPVDISVEISRSFRFVDSEAAAEAQDEEAQEDVLATGTEFNLASLIEDEVLLDLPIIARHDRCPAPVRLSAVDAHYEQTSTEKKNPFAALAGMSVAKTGSGTASG